MSVLLLVVFYQPIIFTVVKLVAPRLAAKQNLRIDSLELGGTIFTGLRVENLRVTPTAPGPIAKANVGLLELHYSLLTLIRHGLNSAFIESVTLHDADVIYDPSKSPPSPPKKKEPFSLPPLPLPERLSLRNVNFQMLPASRETADAAGQSAAASAAVPAPAAPGGGGRDRGRGRARASSSRTSPRTRPRRTTANCGSANCVVPGAPICTTFPRARATTTATSSSPT